MALRILILAFDYKPRVGGIATATFELANALSRIQGNHVKLVAPSLPGAEVGAKERELFECVRVPITSRPLFAVWQTFWELLRIQREFRADVVLSMLWLPSGLAALLVQLFVSKRHRCFTVVHGVEVLEATSTWRKRVRGTFSFVKRLVLKHSSRVLCVSQFTASLVQECGVSSERLDVILNGVDAKKFSPGVRPRALESKLSLADCFVFLTISRLEDYKGIDVFLEAFARLKDRYPKVRYLIGGRGPDQERLEAIVASHGLSEFVRFLGPLKDSELVDYYQLCDAFVLLSRDDRRTPNFEGLGIVLLEAGACGKASLAGNSGGIPEVIENGRTGWLVDPNDVDSIESAALEAITNRELREQMGRQARCRIEMDFAWMDVAHRAMNSFRSGMKEGNG